jgi:hypothetical protein
MPEAVNCSPIKIENEVRYQGVCEVVATVGFRPFIGTEANVKLHLTVSCCMLCCGCNIALKFVLQY